MCTFLCFIVSWITKDEVKKMNKFYTDIYNLVKEYYPNLSRNEIDNYPQFRDKIIKLVLDELMQVDSTARYSQYKIIRLDMEEI